MSSTEVSSPVLVIYNKWKHEVGCGGSCGTDMYSIRVHKEEPQPPKDKDVYSIVIPVSDILDKQGIPHGSIEVFERHNTEQEWCGCGGWTWYQVILKFSHDGEEQTHELGCIDPYDEFGVGPVREDDEMGISVEEFILTKENLVEGEIDASSYEL